MKAVINPRSGIFKNLTEEQYRMDKDYLKEDGFRLMTDGEIRKHFGYSPKRTEKTEDAKADDKNTKTTKTATKAGNSSKS